MAANPVEKDAVAGPQSIEVLAQVAAQTGEPDRAIVALEKLLSCKLGVSPFFLHFGALIVAIASDLGRNGDEKRGRLLLGS